MGIGRTEKPYRPRQYEHYDIDSGVSDAEFHRRESDINTYEERVRAVDPHAFDEEKAERRRVQELELAKRIASQEPLSRFLAGLLDEENPNNKYETYGINEKTTIAELKSVVNNRLSILKAEYEKLDDRYIHRAPDFDYENFEEVRSASYDEASSKIIQQLLEEKTRKEKDEEEARHKIMRNLSNEIDETNRIIYYLNTLLDTDDTIKDTKRRLDDSIELIKHYEAERREDLRLAHEEAKKRSV